VCTNPSRPHELLCLFTTLDLPVAEILGIYKLRWNVETDLRSLQRTVGLHQLNCKSPDMAEKELLLAIAAYNLVRAVMCLAARPAHITPRQLSFSFGQTVVAAALPGLDHAADDEEYQQRNDPHRTCDRSGGLYPTSQCAYDVSASLLQLAFCDGAIYPYFAVPAFRAKSGSEGPAQATGLPHERGGTEYVENI
jgi:hypothetical protein